MQPHLADPLTLFSRNTELVVADSSSTMSTWFSIAIRSTLNTLCDTQCKGLRTRSRASKPEDLHLRELDLTLEHHDSMHACVTLDDMFESMDAHTNTSHARAFTHILTRDPPTTPPIIAYCCDDRLSEANTALIHATRAQQRRCVGSRRSARIQRLQLLQKEKDTGVLKLSYS